MGLLSSVREERTERKAEKKIRKGEEKAIKYRAKAQAKASTAAERKLRKKDLRTEQKFHKRAQKQERKTIKADAKAQQKVAAAEAKTVAEQSKAAAEAAFFTTTKMKRYLAVGRLAAPIVVPIAYRAAVAARAQLTEFQAQRAGVPASVLTQFGGPSAALRARIATSRDSAQKVAATESTAEGRAFVDAMTGRLDNLLVAADAADTMPPAQRKSAQRAIDNELTAIDNDLLARLNVHPA
ncbi:MULTISPECIES: DUF6474 family protein [Gordonia]|jgi:hypothetical protein|uniref:Uncharacterized protein n=1 Tax=Gordonia malaquae NBRC 108250 TaxID=1223542 RepID=M3THJ5_GORML|nr:DUF6474 family protein [Gordonia malaquae]GAC80971.1 hypothetical protein GM1_025_00170 [Gordonia malaquae NBRC 108250]SEE37873.1 hypothetical protein SAMN04488550_4419 [Gordonia malaquae]